MKMFLALVAWLVADYGKLVIRKVRLNPSLSVSAVEIKTKIRYNVCVNFLKGELK